MKVCLIGKRTIGWVIKGETKKYDNVKKIERKMIKGIWCTIIFSSYSGELIVNEENYIVKAIG